MEALRFKEFPRLPTHAKVNQDSQLICAVDRSGRQDWSSTCVIRSPGCVSNLVCGFVARTFEVP